VVDEGGDGRGSWWVDGLERWQAREGRGTTGWWYGRAMFYRREKEERLATFSGDRPT